MTEYSQSGEYRPAKLQLRGDADYPSEALNVRLLPSEQGRLSLESTSRLPVGATATVEYNDVLFLCEIVASTQSVNDAWHSELIVEQTLTSLQSLTNLRAKLLEGAGQSPFYSEEPARTGFGTTGLGTIGSGRTGMGPVKP